ncbi:MAG: type II toxin-antitoxin system PemK/MazF family toxin [Syntrophobacteraceae bacterium]|nr:type II toxin-antitoxin system PemK/MazF family toxin [Syntrophobacteraceae bacterium]
MSSNIKRGEIHRVDFEPVRGSEHGRPRPALVIQNDVGNLYSPITIVIPLTSRVSEKSCPPNVLFKAGVAGLPKNSELVTNQIRAVDKSRVGDRLGSVPDKLMEAVEMAILPTLGMESYTSSLE